MRARIIGLSELSPRDFRDWRELAERAIEPNPFYEPGFVLPAARWIAGDHVGLLIAEDANGWAACLPVRRGWRWGSCRCARSQAGGISIRTLERRSSGASDRFGRLRR